MKIVGTPNANGTYMIKVYGGPAWWRRFVLWTFTIRQKREVLQKTDRYIIFDRLKEDDGQTHIS